MADSEAIATVRDFNRFFTQFVGALNAEFLGTDMTLTEARVLFEVAQGHASNASELEAALDLDAGYLSRILKRFEGRGWIERTSSGVSRRQTIALSKNGRSAFRTMDVRQSRKVSTILDGLTQYQQNDLTAALSVARVLLAGNQNRSFALRVFRTGDMSMIAARQSLLYRETYGWGPQIEVHEGEVTTAFLRNFKEGREQCWVAEIGNAMAGSVFLTDEGDAISRLRLLYVEPFARGLGIGRALVSECIDFARDVGYNSVILWTHTILETARRIYEAQGFRIIESKMHSTFGMPLQGETWRLDL